MPTEGATPENNTQDIQNQQQVVPTQPATPQGVENSNSTSLFNSSFFNLNATRAPLLPVKENKPPIIDFALGLDRLQISNPGLSGLSFGGGFSGGYEKNVTDVQLNGQMSGYWVSDPALKQVGMVMTVFQSFPVKIEGMDRPYTMVVDQTSTVDNAGTNKGDLCIGTLGCPDGYNVALLNKVASNTKGGGFKVGASFWNARGLEYLNHFYPEVGFTIEHVNKMRRACLLNAEVVIPTSGTSGKAFRIKMVDEGPRPPYAYVKGGSNAGLWKLDIIGAFCMLTENQGLFDIHGKLNGKMTRIDNTTIQFPFKDSKYDILTGEIQGYTPEAMKELVSTGQVNPNTAMITKYFGHPAGGEVACRVKFYVDPTHREKAEKIVGKPLPDDFFKTNGNYTAGLDGVNFVPGDGTIGSLIRQAATLVSGHCTSNRIGYGYIGSYIKRPDGVIIGGGRTIDCASGINCILATAGIFKFSAGEMYGNTAWWRNGGHLKKLAPGYTATKVFAGNAVPPEILEPGDIVLYDMGKDSYNHVSLYMSPTEHVDFGSAKKVSTSQPLAQPVRTTKYKPGIREIIVWRFTSTAATSSEIA